MTQTFADAVTPQQTKAILALVSGMTISDAAKDAKCDRATIRRWIREEPEFQQALTQAKRDSIEDTRAQVQTLTPLAIRKVHEILTAKLSSRYVSPNTQLRAALTVLVGAEVMAEVDRRVMMESVVVQSSNSARELLTSELARLAERGSASGTVIETHGVAV